MRVVEGVATAGTLVVFVPEVPFPATPVDEAAADEPLPALADDPLPAPAVEADADGATVTGAAAEVAGVVGTGVTTGVVVAGAGAVVGGATEVDGVGAITTAALHVPTGEV